MLPKYEFHSGWSSCPQCNWSTERFLLSLALLFNNNSSILFYSSFCFRCEVSKFIHRKPFRFLVVVVGFFFIVYCWPFDWVGHVNELLIPCVIYKRIKWKIYICVYVYMYGRQVNWINRYELNKFEIIQWCRSFCNS